MIEIDLLPEELKLSPKKEIKKIETKQFLRFLPAVCAIVIIIHIYFAFVLLVKNFQFQTLEKKWQGLKPQKKALEEFQKESALLSRDTQVIEQFIKQRVIWAEKLNRLSLDLPAGIWFNEISILAKDFKLKGSAVSTAKTEISLINKFLNNLKNDNVFFKDFVNLELGSVQVRIVGVREVVDFIFTGTLK